MNQGDIKIEDIHNMEQEQIKVSVKWLWKIDRKVQKFIENSGSSRRRRSLVEIFVTDQWNDCD